MSNTVDRVRAIVADLFQLPAAEVTASSSPDTISDWDSMHHLQLVLALETEFGAEFSPEEIDQLLSVELIADLIDEKLAATKAA